MILPGIVPYGIAWYWYCRSDPEWLTWHWCWVLWKSQEFAAVYNSRRKTLVQRASEALRLKATLTTLLHNTTHTCRNPTYVPGPRDPGIVFFSRLFWYLNPGCSWEAFKQPSAGGNIFASGFVMEMKANEQQQRWRGWCWLWLFGQEAMELLAGEGRPGQAAHIGSR